MSCIRDEAGVHRWEPNEVCCPQCGRHFFDPEAERARCAEFDHRHADPFEPCEACDSTGSCCHGCEDRE